MHKIFIFPFLRIFFTSWPVATHTECKKNFSNFSCRFLNPNFFPIRIVIVLRFQRKLQEQVQKKFCFKNLILNILQILGLKPRISKVFLDHSNIFLLTVGQNNFGNKILMYLCMYVWMEKKSALETESNF